MYRQNEVKYRVSFGYCGVIEMSVITTRASTHGPCATVTPNDWKTSIVSMLLNSGKWWETGGPLVAMKCSTRLTFHKIRCRDVGKFREQQVMEVEIYYKIFPSHGNIINQSNCDTYNNCLAAYWHVCSTQEFGGV